MAIKSKSQALLMGLIALAIHIPASAEIVNLDFSVHLYVKDNGPVGSATWIDLTIPFRETLDTTVISSWANGGLVANTQFSALNVPETPFTQDVLSAATNTLSPYAYPPSINRQYTTSVVSGTGTMESAWLRVGSRSTLDPITNQQNLYERGISWGSFFKEENVVMTFTSQSFTSYLQTQIGRSDFSFDDNLMINQGGLTIYNRGYLGNATLLNVAVVPEPEPYALMIAGLGLLGFVASRKKAAIN